MTDWDHSRLTVYCLSPQKLIYLDFHTLLQLLLTAWRSRSYVSWPPSRPHSNTTLCRTAGTLCLCQNFAIIPTPIIFSTTHGSFLNHLLYARYIHSYPRPLSSCSWCKELNTCQHKTEVYSYTNANAWFWYACKFKNHTRKRHTNKTKKKLFFKVTWGVPECQKPALGAQCSHVCSISWWACHYSWLCKWIGAPRAQNYCTFHLAKDITKWKMLISATFSNVMAMQTHSIQWKPIFQQLHKSWHNLKTKSHGTCILHITPQEHASNARTFTSVRWWVHAF